MSHKLILILLALNSLSLSVNAQNSKSNSPAGLFPAAAGLGGVEIAEPQIKTTIQQIDESPGSAKVAAGTMEEFLVFEGLCKKGDGKSCLSAGKILTSQTPPKEIFDLSSTQRINRAIRSYEAAINSGNLEAAELAYDLYYDSNLINRQLNSYTDKDRANELMSLMLNKQYPGGQIRQAREYIENPEYALSLGKKKEACQISSQLSSRSDLTASTKKIVEDLNSGIVCKIAN